MIFHDMSLKCDSHLFRPHCRIIPSIPALRGWAPHGFHQVSRLISPWKKNNLQQLRGWPLEYHLSSFIHCIRGCLSLFILFYSTNQWEEDICSSICRILSLNMFEFKQWWPEGLCWSVVSNWNTWLMPTFQHGEQNHAMHHWKGIRCGKFTQWSKKYCWHDTAQHEVGRKDCNFF